MVVVRKRRRRRPHNSHLLVNGIPNAELVDHSDNDEPRPLLFGSLQTIVGSFVGGRFDHRLADDSPLAHNSGYAAHQIRGRNEALHPMTPLADNSGRPLCMIVARAVTHH